MAVSPAISNKILIPEKKLGRKQELGTSRFLLFMCFNCFSCSYHLFEDTEKFPEGKAECDRKEPI